MPIKKLYIPDFIIIGANKAATTSVSNYLNRHHKIKISDVKEPMFFSTQPTMQSSGRTNATLDRPFFALTLDEYSTLLTPETVDEDLLLGEASTSYLACPFVSAPLMRKIVPNIKLIAILRSPIERAVSAYKMYVGNNLEERPFSEIVENANSELTVLKTGHGGKEYIRNGLYAQLLKPYINFFEKKQLLLLNYDELKNDPGLFMKKIFEFLEVDEINIDFENKFNTAEDNLKGKKVEILKEDLDRLKELYTPEVLELAKIVPFNVKKWIN